MSNELIFTKKHSEEKSKQAELNNLRKKLVNKIEERDYLVFQVIPQVHAGYMLNLGHLEFQAYELNVERLKLKRKSELLQAYINRQESINEQEVEHILVKEFKSYQEKIKALFEELERAKERQKMPELSLEDSKDIKKLYRELVKKLHPDLNSNQTEQEKIYYQQAVEAYERGDLKTLKLLRILTADMNQTVSIDNYLQEKSHLLGLIEKLDQEIRELNSQFPLSELALLADEDELAERKNLVLNEIELLKAEVQRLQEKIKEQLDDK